MLYVKRDFVDKRRFKQWLSSSVKYIRESLYIASYDLFQN